MAVIAAFAGDPLTRLWIGSGEGLLWLGTRDGLFAGDLSAIERSPPRRGLFRRFDAEGPLAHAVCTGRINKVQRSTEMVFPSAQGLVVLDPGATVLRRTAPRTLIESLAATRRDGSIVAGTPAGMIVPADATSVVVQFTALHMAAPEALRFRYRVSRGLPPESPIVDDEWTRVGRDRRVVIRGLPAGRHTFEVRASLDGKYATEGAAATLDVEAHFWQRPDFVAACGAGAAAAVAAVVLVVVRQRYRRRLSRERELQQERERIARDIHDDLGAGLTQVAHLSAMAADNDHDHDQGHDHDAARALFQRICTATTGLTRSLDEIVWAVNPANDSLDKLVSYLAEFAQEFAAGGAPMTGAVARKAVQAFTRTSHAAPAMASMLTAREREVLDMLVQGLSKKEIAARLSVSFATVRTHLEHVYKKLHVRTQAEAVARWLGGRDSPRSP